MSPNNDLFEKFLNNKATEQEAEVVTQWLATPEGQEAASGMMDSDFAQIETGLLGRMDFPAGERYKEIASAMRHKRIGTLLFRIAAVLIPCALILGIGLKLNANIGFLGAPEYAEVQTAKGERVQVIFQDGSRAYLNSESTLRYPQKFGLSARKVTLEGEAYFIVKPNKHRPFTVRVNQAQVKVLGTSFNVNAYTDNNLLSVALDQGRVDVTADNRSYQLQPSECFIYDKSTHTGSIARNESTEQLSRWKDNIISFQDAALPEVCGILERWYDVTFEVKDPYVYKYHYTLTSTANASLDNVLREMELLAPVRFSYSENKVEVSMK